MAKEKKPYFFFPLIEESETCPICGTPFVKSKLRLVLYDGLNRYTKDGMHKVRHCNSCHVPFLTKEDVIEIEKQYPGYHLVTEPLKGKPSRKFLEKKLTEPALPIENMPKHTLVFIGDIEKHGCGAEHLTFLQYIMHGTKDCLVKAAKCEKCKKILIAPETWNKIKYDCPDYFYLKEQISLKNIFPTKKMIYLLNINQYTNNTCPSCKGKLQRQSFYFKNDKDVIMREKKLKECTKCGCIFGRTTSFSSKPYSLYKFSYNFYQEEPYRKEGKHIVVKTGDFLARHSMQSCISKSHSMEDITARIRMVNKAGKEFDYEVPAVRCDTCGKLYILEPEYQKIRAQGVPLCSIVENELWRQEKDFQITIDDDYKGSVMYQHGYNVNANEGLSEFQRHRILDVLVRDSILTKAEICSHLDMLIQRSNGQEVLKNARAKWMADRNYVSKNTEKETETIRVNSINRNHYRKKES